MGRVASGSGDLPRLGAEGDGNLLATGREAGPQGSGRVGGRDDSAGPLTSEEAQLSTHLPP